MGGCRQRQSNSMGRSIVWVLSRIRKWPAFASQQQVALVRSCSWNFLLSFSFVRAGLARDSEKDNYDYFWMGMQIGEAAGNLMMLLNLI